MRSIVLAWTLPVLAAIVPAACGGGEGAGGTGDGGAGTSGPPSETPGGGDGGTGTIPGRDGGPRGEGSCVGLAAQPKDAVWSLPSDAGARSFRVHVPPSYDPAKAMPVVLDFHGYTSNAAEEDFLDHMTAKGDAAGFIVVQPEGLDASWNAGACCGQSASTGVDDVGFVGAVIDALEAKLCVDTARVYATGMSNGGFLSHRLGCELASRIAAIAPVAAVLGVTTCNPSRPMPVMHFHGTADTLVAYDGGQNGFISVPESFAGWAKRDGCTGEPVETFRKGDAHCATYAACAGKSEVTLCTIDGGGHTWPGGTPIPTGNTSTSLSATDAMWTFFEAHPLE